MSVTLNLASMVPIRIVEFVPGTKFPVDVYVRLSDDKFVLIGKENARSSADMLTALQQKNVEYLFIRKDDYSRFVGSNLVIAGVVVSHQEISSAKKADYLLKASAKVMQEIESLGMNREAFEHAKVIASTTTTLVESKTDIFNILESIDGISEELLAHSVAVSIVAVMIAKMQGWASRTTIEKLSLAGLLHDVGLKEIPETILKKRRSDLTLEELQIYETHAYRGMEILRTLPNVPDDIISAAYEHHENAIAQGYPRKLRDVKVNPFAKIVGLADAFVELTVKSSNTPIPKTPLEAINAIEIIMGQPYNRESFTALKLLIKKKVKAAA